MEFLSADYLPEQLDGMQNTYENASQVVSQGFRQLILRRCSSASLLAGILYQKEHGCKTVAGKALTKARMEHKFGPGKQMTSKVQWTATQKPEREELSERLSGMEYRATSREDGKQLIDIWRTMSEWEWVASLSGLAADTAEIAWWRQQHTAVEAIEGGGCTPKYRPLKLNDSQPKGKGKNGRPRMVVVDCSGCAQPFPYFLDPNSRTGEEQVLIGDGRTVDSAPGARPCPFLQPRTIRTERQPESVDVQTNDGVNFILPEHQLCLQCARDMSETQMHSGRQSNGFLTRNTKIGLSSSSRVKEYLQSCPCKFSECDFVREGAEYPSEDIGLLHRRLIPLGKAGQWEHKAQFAQTQRAFLQVWCHQSRNSIVERLTLNPQLDTNHSKRGTERTEPMRQNEQCAACARIYPNRPVIVTDCGMARYATNDSPQYKEWMQNRVYHASCDHENCAQCEAEMRTRMSEDAERLHHGTRTDFIRSEIEQTDSFTSDNLFHDMDLDCEEPEDLCALCNRAKELDSARMGAKARVLRARAENLHPEGQLYVKISFLLLAENLEKYDQPMCMLQKAFEDDPSGLQNVAWANTMRKITPRASVDPGRPLNPGASLGTWLISGRAKLNVPATMVSLPRGGRSQAKPPHAVSSLELRLMDRYLTRVMSNKMEASGEQPIPRTGCTARTGDIFCRSLMQAEHFRQRMHSTDQVSSNIDYSLICIVRPENANMIRIMHFPGYYDMLSIQSSLNRYFGVANVRHSEADEDAALEKKQPTVTVNAFYGNTERVTGVGSHLIDDKIDKGKGPVVVVSSHDEKATAPSPAHQHAVKLNFTGMAFHPTIIRAMCRVAAALRHGRAEPDRWSCQATYKWFSREIEEWSELNPNRVSALHTLREIADAFVPQVDCQFELPRKAPIVGSSKESELCVAYDCKLDTFAIAARDEDASSILLAIPEEVNRLLDAISDRLTRLVRCQRYNLMAKITALENHELEKLESLYEARRLHDEYAACVLDEADAYAYEGIHVADLPPASRRSVEHYTTAISEATFASSVAQKHKGRLRISTNCSVPTFDSISELQYNALQQASRIRHTQPTTSHDTHMTSATDISHPTDTPDDQPGNAYDLRGGPQLWSIHIPPSIDHYLDLGNQTPMISYVSKATYAAGIGASLEDFTGKTREEIKQMLIGVKKRYGFQQCVLCNNNQPIGYGKKQDKEEQLAHPFCKVCENLPDEHINKQWKGKVHCVHCNPKKQDVGQPGFIRQLADADPVNATQSSDKCDKTFAENEKTYTRTMYFLLMYRVVAFGLWADLKSGPRTTAACLEHAVSQYPFADEEDLSSENCKRQPPSVGVNCAQSPPSPSRTAKVTSTDNKSNKYTNQNCTESESASSTELSSNRQNFEALCAKWRSCQAGAHSPESKSGTSLHFQSFTCTSCYQAGQRLPWDPYAGNDSNAEQLVREYMKMVTKWSVLELGFSGLRGECADALALEQCHQTGGDKKGPNPRNAVKINKMFCKLMSMMTHEKATDTPRNTCDCAMRPHFEGTLAVYWMAPDGMRLFCSQQAAYLFRLTVSYQEKVDALNREPTTGLRWEPMRTFLKGSKPCGDLYFEMEKQLKALAKLMQKYPHISKPVLDYYSALPTTTRLGDQPTQTTFTLTEDLTQILQQNHIPTFFNAIIEQAHALTTEASYKYLYNTLLWPLIQSPTIFEPSGDRDQRQIRSGVSAARSKEAYECALATAMSSVVLLADQRALAHRYEAASMKGGRLAFVGTRFTAAMRCHMSRWWMGASNKTAKAIVDSCAKLLLVLGVRKRQNHFNKPPELSVVKTLNKFVEENQSELVHMQFMINSGLKSAKHLLTLMGRGHFFDVLVKHDSLTRTLCRYLENESAWRTPVDRPVSVQRVVKWTTDSATGQSEIVSLLTWIMGCSSSSLLNLLAPPKVAAAPEWNLSQRWHSYRQEPGRIDFVVSAAAVVAEILNANSEKLRRDLGSVVTVVRDSLIGPAATGLYLNRIRAFFGGGEAQPQELADGLTTWMDCLNDKYLSTRGGVHNSSLQWIDPLLLHITHIMIRGSDRQTFTAVHTEIKNSLARNADWQQLMRQSKSHPRSSPSALMKPHSRSPLGLNMLAPPESPTQTNSNAPPKVLIERIFALNPADTGTITIKAFKNNKWTRGTEYQESMRNKCMDYARAYPDTTFAQALRQTPLQDLRYVDRSMQRICADVGNSDMQVEVAGSHLFVVRAKEWNRRLLSHGAVAEDCIGDSQQASQLRDSNKPIQIQIQTNAHSNSRTAPVYPIGFTPNGHTEEASDTFPRANSSQRQSYISIGSQPSSSSRKQTAKRRRSTAGDPVDRPGGAHGHPRTEPVRPNSAIHGIARTVERSNGQPQPSSLSPAASAKHRRC